MTRVTIPWWPSSRERGRTRPIDPVSPERVVDAALELLRIGGLDALSMRKVAAELGVSVSTVYWWAGQQGAPARARRRRDPRQDRVAAERSRRRLDRPAPRLGGEQLRGVRGRTRSCSRSCSPVSWPGRTPATCWSPALAILHVGGSRTSRRSRPSLARGAHPRVPPTRSVGRSTRRRRVDRRAPARRARSGAVPRDGRDGRRAPDA